MGTRSWISCTTGGSRTPGAPPAIRRRFPWLILSSKPESEKSSEKHTPNVEHPPGSGHSRCVAREKIATWLGACEPLTAPLVCAKGSENPIQFARQSLIKEASLGHHLMLGSAGQFVYSVSNVSIMCKWLCVCVQHLKSKSNLNQNKMDPLGLTQRRKMTQTGKIS